MSKKQTTVNFPKDKKASIINYDLSNYGYISAAVIADASNGKLHNTMTVGKIVYNLPNTTLWGWINRVEAENEFIKAFNKVKDKEILTRLFIVEVDSKDGLISNNE